MKSLRAIDIIWSNIQGVCVWCVCVCVGGGGGGGLYINPYELLYIYGINDVWIFNFESP